MASPSWFFVALTLFPPPVLGEDGYYGRRVPKDSGTLTVTAIEAAIGRETPAFTSVETFLQWLGKDHPAHLEGVTFVRKSHSAQGASDTHPRAIVFGPDARFLYTFNGHPDQKGFHQIEIIAFQEKAAPGKSWEFRELSFSPDGKSRPALSAANPAKCTRCHQSPLRPIWEQYDQWPGVYGSDDDGLADYRNNKYVQHYGTQEFQKEKLEELDGFRSFQKIIASHPRYQKLKLPEGSPVTPYNPQRRGDYKFRTNLFLTEALALLHAKHLVNWMRGDSELFKTLGPALAHHLILACQAPIHEDKFTPLMKSRTEELLNRLYPGRTLAPFAKTGWVGADSFAGKLYGAFGIEHVDYNLGRSPEHWSYFVGAFYLDVYVMRELYLQLSQEIEGLPSFSMSTTYNQPFEIVPAPTETPLEKIGQHDVCAVLEGKARLGSPLTSRTKVAVSPVATCLDCHGEAGTESAPRIDFENGGSPGWIERVIQRVKSAEPGVRMPPERALSQKEIETLEAYLLNHQSRR